MRKKIENKKTRFQELRKMNESIALLLKNETFCLKKTCKIAEDSEITGNPCFHFSELYKICILYNLIRRRGKVGKAGGNALFWLFATFLGQNNPCFDILRSIF